jgi:hypothetical protein
MIIINERHSENTTYTRYAMLKGVDTDKEKQN